MPVLLELINSPSADIRHSALDKLRFADLDERSAEDRVLLDKMRSALESDDRETRNTISLIIRRLVTKQSAFFTASLLGCLRAETDPEIQSNLIDALAKIGDAKNNVIQLLENVARHGKKDSALSAIHAIADLDATDRTASTLFVILQERNDNAVWKEAATALLTSEAHGDAAVKTIARLLKRNAALATDLWPRGLSTSAISALIALLEDEKQPNGVRKWSAQILAQHRDDERVAVLFRKLSASGNTDLRGVAERVLEDLEEPKEIPSLDVFASLSAKQKCSTLLNSRGDVPEELVVLALSDKDSAVRKSAVESVSAIKRPTEQLKTVFARALEDSEKSVRRAAVFALRPFPFGESLLLTPEIVRKLIAIVQAPKLSSEERETAVAVLAHSSPELVVPVLERLLVESRPLRVPILQTLRAFGPKAKTAEAAIRTTFSDSNEDVRMAAAQACTDIFPPPSKMPAPAVAALYDAYVAEKVHRELCKITSVARCVQIMTPMSGSFELPNFSWTRPAAIAAFGNELPRELAGAATDALEKVREKFCSALQQTDPNFEFGLFAAPGGFVVLSKIERIERNGAPLPGLDRWTKFRVLPKTWIEAMEALFLQRPGLFRCFAFIVTDDPNPSFLDEPLSDIREGSQILPDEVANLPLGEKNCFLYLYCFEKMAGGKMNIAANFLSPRVHLEKAGILGVLAAVH